jgi:hypothetical protein
MAVWNVHDAQNIITEIINDESKPGSNSSKLSLAEKVRHKAAAMRKKERLHAKRESASRGPEGLEEVPEEE